eukprot:7702414-Pyramimonas_sp.AAC.1
MVSWLDKEQFLRLFPPLRCRSASTGRDWRTLRRRTTPWRRRSLRAQRAPARWWTWWRRSTSIVAALRCSVYSP